MTSTTTENQHQPTGGTMNDSTSTSSTAGPLTTTQLAEELRETPARAPWMSGQGNRHRTEAPSFDPAPARMLPTMDMSRLTAILAGYVKSQPLTVMPDHDLAPGLPTVTGMLTDPDKLISVALECAAFEADRERQVTALLDGVSPAARARILASLTVRYRKDYGALTPDTEQATA